VLVDHDRKKRNSYAGDDYLENSALASRGRNYRGESKVHSSEPKGGSSHQTGGPPVDEKEITLPLALMIKEGELLTEHKVPPLRGRFFSLFSKPKRKPYSKKIKDDRCPSCCHPAHYSRFFNLDV